MGSLGKRLEHNRQNSGGPSSPENNEVELCGRRAICLLLPARGFQMALRECMPDCIGTTIASQILAVPLGSYHNLLR